MLQMLNAQVHVSGSECTEERQWNSRWTAERGVETGWEEADVRHTKAPDATQSTEAMWNWSRERFGRKEGHAEDKGFISMTISKCKKINICMYVYPQSGEFVHQQKCENQQINQYHSEKLHSIQLLDCTCDFICHLSKCQVVFQRALTLLAFQLHVLTLLKASQSCRGDSWVKFIGKDRKKNVSFAAHMAPLGQFPARLGCMDVQQCCYLTVL